MSTHSHANDAAWPFGESTDTATFCCEHVFTHDRPILYVRHERYGDWQFLCGEVHGDGGPRLVCLGCIIDRDGSLLALADLPAGWEASREHLGAVWVKEESEPDEDDVNDA